MKTIWETRRGDESEEERLADRLARSERPEARLARVRAKQTDPAQVAALRRLWAA